MQSVNDDMDELFRRAAKDYPLDTNSADWNKVARQLDTSAKENTFKRNNRKYLWLLLLLPFSIICNQYFVEDKGSRIAVNKSSEKRLPNDAGIENQLLKPAQTEIIEKASKGSVELSSPKQPDHINLSANQQLHKASLVKENKVQGEENVDPAANSFQKDEFPLQNESPTYGKPYLVLPQTLKTFSYVPKPLDVQPHKGIVTGAGKAVPASEIHHNKFYAGLIGGLNATSIKFQKVDNTSFDLGVLLGYRIGKKWGMEGGLLLNKKFYYTKGEYFNTDKIRSFMPPNSEIASVNGDCSMWEIPLSIRYDFKAAANQSLFVTAGVSSYLMNSEDYNYVYYYPSTGQTWDYYKSYPSNSKYLLSNLQLSAGYTFKLGKSSALRFEPYIKVPMKGMGIGSIHLQSAGFHIGISKEVF
jgi:hypothetical protein